MSLKRRQDKCNLVAKLKLKMNNLKIENDELRNHA